MTEGVDGEAAENPSIDMELEPGGMTTFTFEEAGEVKITCLFHDTMNLAVTVE